MTPELTNKDYKILEFIANFNVCRLSHIKAFVGYNQKNIYRLSANHKIEVEGNDVRLTNLKNKETDFLNTLKVLDILVKFLDKGYITKDTNDIRGIDMPYYALAKSSKAEVYLYFTFINKGKEALQCKLIDNENRGNVVVILESEEQLESLTLTTKVAKIVFYNQKDT